MEERLGRCVRVKSEAAMVVGVLLEIPPQPGGTRTFPAPFAALLL